MSERPTVFVVGDDASIRGALSPVVTSASCEVVGYATADAFLAAYDGRRSGCVIHHQRMPAMDGLAMQAELQHRKWAIPVIFITAHGTVELATRAMKAGAVYFFESPVDPPRLLASIQEALVLDKQRRQRLGEEQAVAQRLSKLTRRQRHILELVLKGLTSKQIAESLGRSIKTVEVHRSQILRRMNVQGLAELMHVMLAAPASPGTPGNGSAAVAS